MKLYIYYAFFFLNSKSIIIIILCIYEGSFWSEKRVYTRYSII